MTVKAILSRKGGDVATIAPTASLSDAVKLLAERRIGAIVITGPDDRVAVRVPDLDDREHQVFLLRLPARDAREEPFQLPEGGQLRVIHDRPQLRDGNVGEALDDRLEQRLLRIEVVVEGALGGVELVQDVLDAHRLVALGLDEALGDVQEGVTTDRMEGWVHRPRHGRHYNRPTVGLFIRDSRRP